MCVNLHVNRLLFVSLFNKPSVLSLSTDFSTNSCKILTKIGPAGTDSLHADGRTDRHDEPDWSLLATSELAYKILRSAPTVYLCFARTCFGWVRMGNTAPLVLTSATDGYVGAGKGDAKTAWTSQTKISRHHTQFPVLPSPLSRLYSVQTALSIH